ncbi:MAG TPA: XkdF-like putative serine protease domain-containing protein [Stellaceae bacterium]|jgi:phage head maturation protease|nr:XkdF-like putative serine protease domain-containing protein [Stellaceae bacterium]
MRFYWPIAKVDAEQRMVWGYASTEAEDDQGETVTRDALAAAFDDYMRFANIREMHQASAVGVATEAAIDERGLYLGARIIDDDAWRKVVEGVYKGFSIGGRVTARDPADRRTITGLCLTEISVVDRPANPEAVFDCWKLASRDPPVDFSTTALHDGISKALLAGVGPVTARLAKLADDILPRLDALQKRVDDIARTPLPPLTAARGVAGLSKREDGSDVIATQDDVVAALARMSDEERALTLIKAAHATPARLFQR